MFQTYYKNSNISVKLVSVLLVEKSQKEKREFKLMYQISRMYVLLQILQKAFYIHISCFKSCKVKYETLDFFIVRD
jgi:hypothetical protein